MYTNALAKTGAGITVGGVTLSALNLMWLGVAVAVAGGLLITLAKFGPRIAIDAMPHGVRGTRFRLTHNGRPIRFRR